MVDEHVLNLIMARLERIEKQNDDQLEFIREHLEKDSAYYQTTERHSTYFKIMGFGLTPLLAYVVGKIGLK